MRYNDGFPMDANLRVTKCPKCGNEEFSKDANYCRICGTLLYNVCDGENIVDGKGHYVHHEGHRNQGNARFCEKCGQPTAFFKAKFLRSYTEVREDYVDRYLQENTCAFSDVSSEPLDEEDDEIPF